MKSNVNYGGSILGGSSGIVGTENIENGAVTPEKLSKKYLSLQDQPIGTDVPNDGNVYVFTYNITAPGKEEAENVSYSFYRGYSTSDGEKLYKWESPIFVSDKISTENIEDKSITNAKIADYSIDQMKLAQAAVSNNRIQNGAIDSRTIADGAVNTDKIADKSITLSKLSDDIISDGSITIIPDNSISTSKIQDDAVTSEKIAKQSVTTYNIKYGAVTPDRLSFYNYRSAPDEIGAYEGEKVYRMIFHENFQRNNSIWTDKAWSPLLHNQYLFNDINKIFIINGLAFLKYSSTPCWIDDPVVHLHGTGCNFDWSEDQYNANYEGIYGYIEFVTPSNNLKKTQE